MCQREKFIELIEAEIKLQLVEIPHWAGLGGVCYIPPEQRRSPDDQGNLLMGIDRINNMQIHAKYRQTAFQSARWRCGWEFFGNT